MSRFLFAALLVITAFSLDAAPLRFAKGAEDTTLRSAQPDASFGGAATLGVGAGEKALVRFAVPPGTRAESAALELNLEKVEGDWKGAELVVYAVSPAAAGWAPGKADGATENGATCWNYLLFSDIRNIQTGLPMHTPMPGAKGLGQAGTDYLPAPLARIPLADAKPGKLSIPLADPGVVAGWASGGANPGLLLVAEKAADGARVLFSSSQSPREEARPALVVTPVSVEVTTGDAAPGTIHYELKNAGRVSLAVCDAQGRIVRELLHAAERTAGPHDEAWDGIGEDGAKAPAGKYTWKLLRTEGLHAEYLTTLGLSVDFFKLWPGNHVGATGLAVDASGVYVGSGCSEARGFVLKMTPEGERLWTLDRNWFEAWQGPHSIAIDGEHIFLMQENYDVIRLGAADGAQGPTWDLVFDKTKPKDRPASTRDDGGWVKMKLGLAAETAAVDLAAGQGKLVMSYENFDRLRWIDEATGKIAREVEVKAPLGVAVDLKGRVLVISEGAILAYEEGSSSPRTFLAASALESPWRIAVDRKSGDVWVVERGASQQVKRFSADGQLLKTFGPRGGRPAQGLYDGQSGFRNINSLAVAPDGSFWIAEAFAAPRRIAHFDAEGKLLREWYGPQMYANRAFVDPADPTLVWMDSMWGEVIQAKVDYAAKSWTVRATYSYANPLQPRYRHENGMWFVAHRDGKTYLAKETEPDVFLVDEPGRRLVPMAKIGTSFYPGGDAGWRIPEAWRPAESPWPGQTSPQPQPAAPWHFTWFNRNGEAAIPPGSLEFGKELYTYPHHSFVRPDLTYVTAITSAARGADGQWTRIGGPTALKPVSFTPAGAPVYDTAQIGNIPIKVPDVLGAIRCLWEDGEGNIFTAHNVTKSLAGKGPFGVGKTSNWLAGNYVAKWAPDGTLKWIAGHHTAAAKPGPGEVRNFYRMAGTVKGCIAVNDLDYGMTHVWDQDGLWVGRLLEDGLVTDAIPSSAYELCGENFGGYVFENAKDGQVYFLGDSYNATPLYRITGWDRFERQQGSVELK